MPPSPLPPLTLKLDKLVYGGDAMGRTPDGRAAFVPFALPGEYVRVRVVEEKRGHLRAELEEVLNASPDRIAPRCPHFGVCGGCHYQHMPYETQLGTKSAILTEQLTRIGRLVDPPVSSTIPSPDPFHYRNHVQFHLAGDGSLGFFKTRSNEVLPIQVCHLPVLSIDSLWKQLEIDPVPGLDRIGLRVGAEGDIQIIFESSDPQPFEFGIQDLPFSAIHLGPAGALVLAGEDTILIEVLGRPFQVSAGSFFQVNTPMAGAMVEHVLTHGGRDGGTRSG
jgi:23S rRNA (uracil1939-C5)-methyltransferase